jgi:predicted transcriptional regulator
MRCVTQRPMPSRFVYTGRYTTCTMPAVERLNITLDDESAAKLERLAERMHLQPGTVARSLLSSALDEADPDARNVTELLDRIPGAYEAAQLGLEEAKRGETISVDEL